jgi:wolfamin
MVLQQFDVSVSLDDTQSQYAWNSLTPYLAFFATLPLVVVSFALANKAYVPCSEMFVLAAGMTGFCFVGLSDEYDKLTFLLLSAHTVASLPVFLQGFPQIPLVAWGVGVLTRPLLSLDTGLGLSFHLSIPSLCYLAMPLFFVRLGMRKSWSGLHRVLIPHLVCYFWYNMATAAFPFTTWLGLVRATVGYLLLPLLVPLSLLVSLLAILYAAYRLTQTQMLGKIVVTCLLLAVPLMLTQTKALFGGKVSWEVFSGSLLYAHYVLGGL